MRLIYLILSTIFGALALFFILGTLFRFRIALLIISIILSSIFFLVNWQYRKISRKDKEKLIEEKIARELEKLNFLEKNQEALFKYSQDVSHILMTRLHLKGPYRPRFIQQTEYDVTPADYIFFKNGFSPDKAAQIIFDEIVAQGDEFSPQLIQEKYLAGKLPRFAIFYKVIFGSYNPSVKNVLTIAPLFGSIFLLFYGMSHAFIGPYSDTYIPSAEWIAIAKPSIWVFSLLSCIFLYKSKSFHHRLKQKYAPTTRYFFYCLYPPMIFAFFYFTVNVGAGKALNQIVGEEKISYLSVIKDLETDKRAYRRHVDAYCVKINAPSVGLGADEYCLQKAHYDQLPRDKKFIMKFHGISSYFGYRIDGYYEGFSTSADLLDMSGHI